MRKTFILLLIFLLTSPSVFAADNAPLWQERGVFVHDAPLVPVDGLTVQCPLFQQETEESGMAPGLCVYDFPVLEETCDMVTTQDVDIYGGNTQIVLRTMQSITYDKGEDVPYKCQMDKVALFEVPEDGLARLIWSDAVERSDLSISDVQIYNTTEGKSILVVLYCDGDTEVCRQGALIWTGSKWKKLGRDGSWNDVYKNLPAGYQRHKILPVDFARMTQEVYLLGPHDDMCCPSGRLNFELALEGNSLSVGSYGFFIPVEETEEMREMREAE